MVSTETSWAGGHGVSGPLLRLLPNLSDVLEHFQHTSSMLKLESKIFVRECSSLAPLDLKAYNASDM